MELELETINKLYLELSQFVTATTARELRLEKALIGMLELNACRPVLNENARQVLEARRVLGERNSWPTAAAKVPHE